MASWDDVRRIALALPETDESVVHEHASWRVRNKGFVWERPLRRADLEARLPGLLKAVFHAAAYETAAEEE